MGVASGDPSARVRVAALETLSVWDSVAEFSGFARKQFEARHSYAAMGAAARIVAAAEKRESLPWLKSRLEESSLHDALRTALIPAVALAGGNDATELLRQGLFDDTWEVGAREAAARALAPLAKGRSDISRDACALLGTTRQFRLQSALIQLLSTLDDGQARQALGEFHARSIDARQRRAIEAHFEKVGG
jgi:hypothetical protein